MSNSESHLEQNIDKRVDEILAHLDNNTVVPDGLVEKVIASKKTILLKEHSGFDFSKYLQIAAVFAAAVCIGIVMGKNADLTSFNKKQNRKEQALIQLKEQHHLSENYFFGRL